jgi:hypothetical protein
VGLVGTGVSEERVASIFRVEEIRERGKMLDGTNTFLRNFCFNKSHAAPHSQKTALFIINEVF